MLEFHFDCVPKKAREMGFHFGNHSSRYGANNLYFTRDGKPFLPIAGELHFSRLPREMWERELLKMKDTGITMVSTYVFWNYHEPEEGVFDFSGDKDIAHFLSLCRKTGLPCVLRIGPWCHGEVVYGGFPRYVNRMPRSGATRPDICGALSATGSGSQRKSSPISMAKRCLACSSRMNTEEIFLIFTRCASSRSRQAFKRHSLP